MTSNDFSFYLTLVSNRLLRIFWSPPKVCTTLLSRDMAYLRGFLPQIIKEQIMANCCIPNIFHGSQKTSLNQYLSRKNEFYGFSRWNIRWENCKDNHVGVFKIGDFWRIKNSKGSKYWVFEKTGIGGLKGYLELIFAPSGQ